MRRSLSITKNLSHNTNHAVLTRRAGQATFSHLSRRAFAQVRDDHDRSLSEGWFASNTQLNSTSLQNRADDIKPVDERTLKLGKSTSVPSHTTAVEIELITNQPSKSCTPPSPTSSPPRSPKKSSRPQSPSTSSPRHTPTSPPSQADSHTTPLSGQLL